VRKKTKFGKIVKRFAIVLLFFVSMIIGQQSPTEKAAPTPPIVAVRFASGSSGTGGVAPHFFAEFVSNWTPRLHQANRLTHLASSLV
jgi:hypothetical protein